MQITIESPDPAIRKVNGKFPVPNEVVEATVAAASDEGCGKLSLLFMVGLSGQTPAKAMETVAYCRHLVERFGADQRLHFYVAPLGPPSTASKYLSRRGSSPLTAARHTYSTAAGPPPSGACG